MQRVEPRRHVPARFLSALALGAFLLASFLPAPADGARRDRRRPVEELVNPLLSPRYALWLVGPISYMASEKEIKAYTSLVDDQAAEAFIEEFWHSRDPDPRYEANPLRETFDERAAEADRAFTEAGSPGRNTDRGTIFVLYGPPEETDYEISDHPDDPPILLWKYPAKAPKGLDGKEPARFYRFIKRDQRTVFFTPNRKPARPRLGPP